VTVAGVVLAAGGGSRFDGPGHKLLSLYRGRPLIAHVLESASAAGLDAVAVVTGAVEIDGLVPEGVTVLVNPAWGEGLSTSVGVGLAWAAERGHDVVVFGLGDMPGVPATAWNAVAFTESDVAVASFDGALRPPVRLARSVWADVPTSGDVGARALWHRPGTVEVPCVGIPIDVDTTEDLDQLGE
jgi:molybdenum cofactor cytidylyltransferase